MTEWLQSVDVYRIGMQIAGQMAAVPEAGEPLVYIGGVSAARSEQALRENGVTHIVELTATGIDHEGFGHDGLE